MRGSAHGRRRTQRIPTPVIETIEFRRLPRWGARCAARDSSAEFTARQDALWCARRDVACVDSLRRLAQALSLEPALGFERGHAASAGGRDGLAEHGVLHVAGGED